MQHQRNPSLLRPASSGLLLVAVVFVALTASPARAERSEVVFEPREIVDPSGNALHRFHTALGRTARREEGALTRIAHYGDSLIVSDLITSSLRAAFQKRYGDGGPGFVLAGRPWGWYRRMGVRNGASSGWKTYRALSGGPADRFFGFGGVTFSTHRPRQRVWYRTDETETGPVTVSSLDLHYLAQPEGGDIEVIIDGVHRLTVSTAGHDAHSAFHRVAVPEGSHEFLLKTSNGPVRIFGAALERSGPGVVYDSLGINGASTTVLGRIDAEHLAEQLRHRQVDLVVVAFGANESNRPGLVEQYQETVVPILGRLREASGGASCLVMSALDRGERLSSGGVRTNPLVKTIVAEQRRAARAAGCAFFDTFAAMGGEQAMWRWSRAGLASGDLVHPTPEGAELIGRGLFQALEQSYHNSGGPAPVSD